MLEGQAIDLSGSGRELTQTFVTLNTELAGNLPEILLSTMFTVTFRTMLFMSSHKIRRLMSIVVTKIRITDKKVSSPFVAGETFLIRSGSGLRITTKRQDAVQRAGERNMAHLASTLKHMMRR